jgi:hypothetical protein
LNTARCPLTQVLTLVVAASYFSFLKLSVLVIISQMERARFKTIAILLTNKYGGLPARASQTLPCLLTSGNMVPR